MQTIIHTSLLKLTKLLKKNKWSLVTAESCTGGGLAYYITHNPDTSDILERGFVSYSEESKQELLKVNPNTIKKYGAVSKQTVGQMALGALNHSRAQISIAITGVAGPNGDGSTAPIGTVWFGIASLHKGPFSWKNQFYGTREEVCEASIYEAIIQLIRYLQD